ncbi:MAG: fluoride efflux transporter CrcB [Candidatus Parcubacteria bacterium]|nr:fluoride efflux transporter CrcB [Burkholderiales bacterium]
MNASGFVAVAVGAVLGAWLRWGLSIWLNPAHPNLPLGTLAANIGGAYAIGLAVAFFSTHSLIAPEWRLVCITGFLGALTTFSTFSAESMELLMAGRYGAAAIHSGAHLFGSIVATLLGFATYRALA